jgi:hypothetical protein
MLVAALLGLGASVSVAPGMLFASLTVPAVALESTLASATLVRESLQGVSGPTLGHYVSTQSVIHSANLEWQKAIQDLFNTSATGVQSATASSAQALDKLATVLGMNDAAAVVVVLLAVGTVAVVLPVIPAMRQRQPT